MAGKRSSGSRNGKAALELFEALGSSLDIGVVLERAYPALLQLVPADYGALGISSTGRPEDYAWIVARLPPAFFAAYPEMARHDFVRASVMQKLNRVLRDEEMVSRAELESNMMYRRAREVGAPLEQVMAVMLHVDARWQSGLSLFREKKTPFSERERETLQDVTRVLANTVRNCHRFGAAQDWGTALEASLAEEGAAMMLIAPPGIEVARTAGVTAILERWFAPHERRGGLPDAILATLAAAAAAPPGEGAPRSWTKAGPQADLEVSFAPVAGYMGQRPWMVRLEERYRDIPLPVEWQPLLTPRQQEVAGAVLRGADNLVIAGQLGCAEATVKKHLSTVFDKLGVPSRAALIARGAELHRR
ncbi:MAG: helix-turn-helix transcriptional regulator [Minicystis sp.]